MSKIILSKNTTTVDSSTGEVLNEVRENTYRLPEEPPYVKMYLDDLIKLNNLPKTTSKVLYELVKKINYDGQLVINASLKRMMSSDIGIKEQSFSNAITGLIKKDVMIRIDKGIYTLNPTLFAKGSWKDVRKLREKYLELKITYINGKRELSSTVSNIIK